MTETSKSEGTTEVLPCPYCGLRVTSHETPLEWRGKRWIGYQTVTHPVPVCFGYKQTRKKPDAFLEAARQMLKSRGASG